MGEAQRPMTNPKAWEAITGFTANIKAAVERLNKFANYFPESKKQFAAVAVRIEAECNSTMKSLLVEALAGIEGKMSDSGSGPASDKPAVLVIGEATGKRIRRLSLAEPYPKSQEIYLAIEFDDDTEIEVDIDVASRLSFGIKHHARDANGEMEPIKEQLKGSIRSLVKQQGGQ